jgi:hypothetical protein
VRTTVGCYQTSAMAAVEALAEGSGKEWRSGMEGGLTAMTNDRDRGGPPRGSWEDVDRNSF